jgi:conjugal transfer pilus assembly protein TraK
MPRNKVAPLAALAATLVCAQAAFAVQILEGPDGATLFAKASNKETSRIALDNGRIASLRVPEGVLNVEADEETGQVFISFPPGAKASVSAWLTTDAGRTYSLYLQPADMGQDSIIIKQPRPTAKQQQQNTASGYAKEIKRAVTYMASESNLPSDVEIKEVNETILLWKEANFQLQRKYISSATIGERFLLTNISSEPMVLQEREFFRKGVRAVSIEQMNLMPGEATLVYIVRERAINE